MHCPDLQVRLHQKINDWQLHPIQWCEDIVGIGKRKEGSQEAPLTLDPKQKEVFIKFARLCVVKNTEYKLTKNNIDYQRTEEHIELCKKIGYCVQAGRGVGKTALAALIALWFLFVFPETKIFAVGPTSKQIKDCLWPEIDIWIEYSRKVYGEHSLLDKIIDTKSKGTQIFSRAVSKEQLGSLCFIRPLTFNRSTSISDQQGGASGRHSTNMLFLIDEAIAVPSHIFETFEHSLNKKQNNVIFAIFNPVKSTGWAIDAHTKHSYKWMTERITAYDCPRLDRQDIDDARLRLGENSAEFRVSYLGLPPLEDSDVWIPYEWITDARWRFSKEEFVPKKGEPLIFGVDFGFGGDKTVICIRHGLRVIEFLEFNSPESEKVVHFVLKHIHDYEPHFVYLEQGGNSLGATQMIKKFHSNATYVVPHVKAFNTKKYSRLKDELFGRMRDAFEAGTISIPDGDDRISTEFKTELSLLKADEDDIHGRIRIRGKRSAGFQKEIMSELKYKSPDKADAFAMTFYHTYEAQYQKNQPQALLQKQKQEQDDDKQSLRCRGKTAWMAH